MDSKLQIISGQYRGHRLFLPPDARPTQNRARIALFNMLESGIINDAGAEMTIWDAFAGSGAFGIECLSRYPRAKVIFTDNAYSSVATVRRNLSMLRIGSWAEVMHRDAIGSTKQFAQEVNLVFIDPPYDHPNLGKSFMKHFGRVATKGTIVIWEQEVGNEVEPDTKKWAILRDKVYGRARFLILQKI